MVHFVDSDEELMWTDDHRPPVPTTQWKPGRRSSTRGRSLYRCIRTLGMRQSRSVSTPARIPAGCRSPARFRTARLQSGIAAVARPDRERVPDLQGRVAPSRAAPRRTPSSNGNGPRGPRRSCSAIQSATAPSPARRQPRQRFQRAPECRYRAQWAPVDRFTLAPKQENIQRTALNAAQLGKADMAELRIQVDKTYVPALLPTINSRDPRELGIRVFHAFVEPR